LCCGIGFFYKGSGAVL